MAPPAADADPHCGGRGRGREARVPERLPAQRQRNPVEELPEVLDAHRVLADQAPLPGVHDPADCLGVAVNAALA
jgi:hypothetical protein